MYFVAVEDEQPFTVEGEEFASAAQIAVQAQLHFRRLRRFWNAVTV